MATSSIAPKSTIRLVVTASAAGTIFEWYDFYIFGSLAAIIAKHFFANVGESRALLFALLTFAAGFAVRPFGALVFGHVGDRIGRKRAFLVTITIMGLATFAIGLLPDYKSIGITGAYLLIGMRVLQGFAVGGEYGGAITYVAEHARQNERGATTGWIQVSASVGLLLALGVILVTRSISGEEAFSAWAWRIPFLLSSILLTISLWIRMKLEESPVFQRLHLEGKTSRAPLAEAFLHWKNLKLVLLVLVGLLMGQGVVWYTAQFYTLFYLQNVVKVDGLLVNELILAVTAIGVPLHLFFAWLSDRVGRKPVMLFGLALATISFLPGFQMLTRAVNPELVEANRRAPVIVVAPPQDCSFQFDLVGQAKIVTACDIARSTLANAGIPYKNEAAPADSLARVRVGSAEIPSVDGQSLSAADLILARAAFDKTLKASLVMADYPLSADSRKVDIPSTMFWLVVFVTAAAALYGPQAAALVEFFPTRIRYSALSLPYHIGVGWFGGFLPATAFAIIAATGNIYAGLWYPVIIAGICFLVTLLFIPETRHRKLTD
jgi:MFS family permease